MADADNTTNPSPNVERAIHIACNAAEASPGCLYPRCDCQKLPRAVAALVDALNQGDVEASVAAAAQPMPLLEWRAAR